ncbi:MAG: hypothetical protein H2045_06375 [Rhizobiales bacterium]|nr:hypothetical protein [Hyphomicrobiales bacterium]
MRFAIFSLIALSFLCNSSYAQGRIEIELTRKDGAKIPALLSSNWYQSACAPTLILSHGMGGSRDGLEYAADAAQNSGYRVINISHLESGPAALKRAFGAADKSQILLDRKIWDGRSQDLASAIEFSMEPNCKPKPFLLGGHSMGAALTMIEAGAIGNPPYKGLDRFDGYIALSPQGTGWAFSNPQAWEKVHKPVLMITGTKDDGFDGDYIKRLEAWEGLPSGQKRLAIVDRATHFTLAGRGGPVLQQRAKNIISEFLFQMKSTWNRSKLQHVRGIDIREK